MARPLPYFWHRVEWSEGCWTWTGSTNRFGYGRHGRHALAHRIAYELAVGPIPHGMVIDHLCRNHSCVNPAHLEPVTNRTNTLRGFGYAANRAHSDRCKNGHVFDLANTYWRRGNRTCRACNREAVARYKRSHIQPAVAA